MIDRKSIAKKFCEENNYDVDIDSLSEDELDKFYKDLDDYLEESD